MAATELTTATAITTALGIQFDCDLVTAALGIGTVWIRSYPAAVVKYRRAWAAVLVYRIKDGAPSRIIFLADFII